MQYIKYSISSLILSAALLLVPAASAQAATLSLQPSATSFKIGEQFTVDMKIDSAGTNINAAQATVNYPTGMLRLVSISKAQSVFNFWVQDPTFSNDTGTMQFIAGTSSGISGSALEVLQMTFQTTGAGSASLSLSNATVTANDGKGTNVLSNAQGASVTVSTAVSSAPASVPASSGGSSSAPVPAPAPVVLPQPVTRTAAPAKGLPDAPNISVALYPDQSKWYNLIGDAIALWDVPADVTAVTVSVDQNPNGAPSVYNAEPMLVDGKDIGSLKEGEWYIHARFKNSIGWGKVGTYKISLDFTPPLPFTIGIDNAKSDDPTPDITFQTQDSLSGVDHALIFIDSQDPITSTSTSMLLPPQKPGPHALAVRVFDKAGNVTGSNMTFTIVPLPSPTIDFLTKRIAQGEIAFISGHALANGSVEVDVLNGNNREVEKETVAADASGGWKLPFGDKLPQGDYTVSVIVRDARQAQSLPVQQAFTIGEKIILSIGPIALGWFEIVLLILFLLFAAGGWGMHYYRGRKITRTAYETMVGRDIDKYATMLLKDATALKKEVAGIETIPPAKRPELNVYLDRIIENVKKAAKYIGEEASRLK